MKKFLFLSLLFFFPFFFSCETDSEEGGELCETCDSHCCGQIGTENCCCFPN